MHIWKLFLVYAVYALLSFVLFISTSGGWSALGIYALAGGFYALSILLLSVIASLLTFKGRTSISFSKGKLAFLLAILILQLFIIFFNISDFGDTPGAVNFFQRLIHQGFSSTPFVPPIVVVIGYLVYLGMLLVLLLWLVSIAQYATATAERLLYSPARFMAVYAAYAIVSAVAIFFLYGMSVRPSLETELRGYFGESVSYTTFSYVFKRPSFVAPSLSFYPRHFTYYVLKSIPRTLGLFGFMFAVVALARRRLSGSILRREFWGLFSILMIVQFSFFILTAMEGADAGAMLFIVYMGIVALFLLRLLKSKIPLVKTRS